jgi:hypothetical protein
MLAHNKLSQIAQQHETEKHTKFWKSFGLPDETARAFASAPVEIQKSLLDRLEGASIGGTEQGQAQQDQQGFAQQGFAQQGFANEPINQQQPVQQQVAQQQGVQQPAEQLEGQVIRQKVGQPITLGPNSAERRHRETLNQQKELAQYKATKEIRHEVAGKATAARQDLKDLDRMEDLSKDNKLDTPGYVEFLKRSGFDIPALMKPDSEEFIKIQANFLRNAKAYFGSRISNYEAEQFLKTIPSLSQSPEGRKRVIANLKYINRAALEHFNSMKEVIAENKGVPPMDLEEKTFDKTEKKMDALADRFKKDLAKPVPKGQNKLITAIQAGLGDIAGGVGHAIKGAGKGAIAGYALLGKTPHSAALGAVAGLSGIV